MSRRGSGVNTFFCIACDLTFSLRFGVGAKKRSSRFCPNCGDTVDVVRYANRPVKEVAAYVWWTTKEEQRLRSLYNSGMKVSTISTEMSRSISAIGSKLKQLGLR